MIGVELLDDPHADPSAVRHALRDIARLNALFGGTHAVVRELEPLFERRETGSRRPGRCSTWAPVRATLLAPPSWRPGATA